MLLLCLLAMTFACSSKSKPTPRGALAPVWRDYQRLPNQRAMAMAGELRRERWVVGIASGHASRAAAEAAAMRECHMRRARARMQSPCRIYAAGDEIVWEGG